MNTPLVEPGRCDPHECNAGSTDNFIIDDIGTTRIGQCINPMAIPDSVPIKQLLKGSMISPWVRIRFEGNAFTNWDYTEITTGNISQPYNDEVCRASIKSFQYGWGTVNQGNKCKVVIVDESGASFKKWWEKIYKNPVAGSIDKVGPDGIGTGVYKMKVTFGWIVVGGDTACPAEATGTASCNSTGPYYSTAQETLLCSPPLWFLPDGITANLENGKYIYELEGNDLIFRAAQQPASWTFGDEASGRIHFKHAVEQLGLKSLPPFNVEFKQWPESGTFSDEPEDLQFYVEPDTATTTALHVHIDAETDVNSTELDLEPPDLEALGPINVWKCQSLNPIAAIQDWMTGVKAKSENLPNGKGITMNYDSTYTRSSPDENKVNHGRLLIFADGIPNCFDGNIDYDSRLRAAYVVNGGRCTPVFSFNHNVKWNFQASMAIGGTLGPNTGQPVEAGINRDCGVPGVGVRTEVVTNTGLMGMGGLPNQMALSSMRAHRRANILFNSIEAELRVQGDPSYWLCSPIYGYGRTIALVVINPFFLDGNVTQTGCPTWSTLTSSACNDVLTNKGWFIKGVEHQIREGSYITTYKLLLVAPRAEVSGAADLDIAPRPMNLGADESRGTDTFICNQGTYTCKNEIVQGGVDIKAAPSEYCDTQACSGNLEVT